eukprot:TRINITY_DN1096_c0_g1_i13.p1 TRINITY_DN1096_c0_g1~~TRINITY_DN1096_c0_g1_i13.p1  ORF type:complete len:1086 (+),score=186.39 TRINITY_DN1096_c0_g1_i13:79-3336(+)
MAHNEEALEEERASMEEEEYFEEGDALETEGVEEGNELGEDTPQASNEGVGDNEINTTSFEELHVSEAVLHDASTAWHAFVSGAASKEAAADAVYTALYEASPALQPLFVSPRAIAAGKFFGAINSFAGLLNDPPALKVAVEGLAFWHLPLEVTPPRIVLFRDGLLDMLQVELGSKLTTNAYAGFRGLLNYVGGAIIYIKVFYAARINLLNDSWAFANKGAEKKDESGEHSKGNAEEKNEGEAETTKKETSLGQNVPTTFPEMFQFNAAVMGFGANIWMNEVLATFHNIVTNVANPNRLEEECDFLLCRISKVSTGKINLAEFKSGMLASLRSLLPKDWTTQHEVAWSWLWELVEKNVMKNMGMPAKWEKAYAKFLDGIDEDTGFRLRRDIYARFFALAPAGQDYFKQSNTYLHLVSTKVLNMVLDVFRDPVRMIDDISGVGLRHVGYGVSAEFFSPFASSTVEVVATFTSDEMAIEGFKWSIGLMAKSTMRTLIEGSTIVMKAINVNTKKSMRKAISNAPRGERFSWMLLIQVGSQNISPLAWAIESGALHAASAMIGDLVTFRADRDKYYYGANDLFTRHPQIVQTLLRDAPTLVPELLDGLVWRSRQTSNGMRRVNFYLKHLLVDPEGAFAKTLERVVRVKDPKLVCNPVLATLSDIVWSRVACRAFMARKLWFVVTLLVFILSQSILGWLEETKGTRIAVFAFRCFIYVFSLGSMLVGHLSKIWKGYRSGDIMKLGGKVSIPAYLENWQESAQLVLAFILIIMLATEPIIYCLVSDEAELFSDTCAASNDVKKPNSIASMMAMFAYFLLLIDLAVFNNRVAAYVLTCGRMVSELALFIFSLVVAVLTFACGLSCVAYDVDEFAGPHKGSLALWELCMRTFSSADYENNLRDEIIALLGIFVFLIVTSCFLLNLFIAQLTCAYSSVYADMVGYARIKRIRIIVETMPGVSPARWQRFVTGMAFDTKIEFNEGDIGVNNGVATWEPAKEHPTTVDIIKRFGGSTSVEVQWPEEEGTGDDDGDKFERIELIIKRAMERLTTNESKKQKVGGSSAGRGASASGAEQETGGGGSEGAGSEVEEVEE